MTDFRIIPLPPAPASSLRQAGENVPAHHKRKTHLASTLPSLLVFFIIIVVVNHHHQKRSHLRGEKDLAVPREEERVAWLLSTMCGFSAKKPNKRDRNSHNRAFVRPPFQAQRGNGLNTCTHVRSHTATCVRSLICGPWDSKIFILVRFSCVGQ